MAYLGTPLVEDDLHIKDFAELLKQQQQRFSSHSDHRGSALSSSVFLVFSHLPRLFLSTAF